MNKALTMAIVAAVFLVGCETWEYYEYEGGGQTVEYGTYAYPYRNSSRHFAPPPKPPKAHKHHAPEPPPKPHTARPSHHDPKPPVQQTRSNSGGHGAPKEPSMQHPGKPGGNPPQQKPGNPSYKPSHQSPNQPANKPSAPPSGKPSAQPPNKPSAKQPTPQGGAKVLKNDKSPAPVKTAVPSSTKYKTPKETHK